MTHFVYDRIELFLWSEGEAMEYCLSECAAWRLQLRLGPIYSSHVRVVMSTISIFSVADHDARVQE
jgi:hypothetical protein